REPHPVCAEDAGLSRAGLRTRAADEERGDIAPAGRIGQAACARHGLVGGSLDLAFALLEEHEHGERHHRTFASSRNPRPSSGTAAAPSPTMRPAPRSLGSASATTSSAGSPRAAGFSSMGFFLAAMMPLSEA